MDITEEEQRHLSTIISQKEKYRRNNERRAKIRRAEGRLEISEYNSIRKDKTRSMVAKLNDLMLSNPRMTRKEIAETLGVSVYRVDQLKRQLRKSKL